MSVVDPGLQPERTGLAWRRTTVSLAVVSLAGTRLLPDPVGLVGLAGLVAAIALLVLGERRYRRVRRALARDPDAAVAGGLLVPLTAATTLLLGAGAAVYVLA
ncbi:DUF202 domain-containing protein [Pseudonocardia sp. WMMC193]|nr:DUF202 domain-containing protein [Pseudonocardia sp. WMMC193]MCF7550361.1 DUF202 domain-containing protein [Pseudonocardia sp. WMMC193]